MPPIPTYFCEIGENVKIFDWVRFPQEISDDEEEEEEEVHLRHRSQRVKLSFFSDIQTEATRKQRGDRSREPA